MAEPNISLDYEDIQQAAAISQGWTTTVADWTAENSLHFSQALARGLNRFWYPEIVTEVYRRRAGQPLESVDPQKQYDHYEWSFLRKNDGTTVTLAAGDYNYTLPDDFSGVIVDDSVNFAAGQEKGMLTKIDAGNMAAMRSKENATGVPVYFCLRPVTYVGATGSRWEMLVYPTPTAAEAGVVVSFDYQFVPNVITSGEYPVGGSQHSQTIVAAILAELEKIVDDDPQGANEFKFQQLIQASIRVDQQIKLGMSGSRFAYPVTNLPSVRLGVDFFELQREVGKMFNYNPNPFTWGHAETQKVRQTIRRGYRLYLYPEALDDKVRSYEWSWMRPTMTFTTAANEKYYLLPDDFERVHGDIHYTSGSQSGYKSLRHIPLGSIHELNSQSTFTSHPSFFATRPVGSDGQGWQRQELVLDPTPNGAFQLTYEYLATQRELSETHPYPLGGEAQAELLLTSCLAMAEFDLTRKRGDIHNHYRTLLVSAIAADMQRTPRYLGYNGDGGMWRFGSRGQARRAGAIGYGNTTYNGAST